VFLLRFAMRSRTDDHRERAALHRAAIDMCRWADAQPSCISIVVSEHHASPDGYLPSPIVLASAVAGATERVPINVSALLLANYEPVKLAEDMAVLDLVSAGRVSYVIGAGYVEREFEMFGVDARRRGALIEEKVAVLRQAWTGEPFELGGRRVHVRPTPLSPGGPTLAYGGSSPAAAKRAARLGLYFMAQVDKPELGDVYRAEAERAGRRPVGCYFPPSSMPKTVFVADDLDAAWDELGEYLMVDATGYAEWNDYRSDLSAISAATSVEQLRAEEGEYRIVTPDVALELLAAGSVLALQPLVGGIPPEIAWPYVRRAAEVSQMAADAKA
jgi:alkanesulfonate monooxygenase SsuD/methylene tetrahydromethanopterin reductase-like flavin-dependent oxidoreductase (luciferase family)